MSSVNDIPNGWIQTAIGEVVELAQGVAINKKTNHVLCDKENGIPLLKINNLLNNTIDQYANPKLVPQQSIIHKNDVIFTRTGQVGEVLTNKFGILHNNSFKVIPKEELHWSYLYWYLKDNRVYKYVQKVAAGSVQKDLNHGAFKTIEFKYPKDIEEQKAIANILTAFDDKIENLQAQNKTLEETAQTIFKEWFGKYQVGDELPDGWRVGELDEVIEFINGYAFKSKDLLKEEEPNCFKVFKMGDIKKGGGFNHDKTKDHFPKESAEKLEKYILKNGDLLMSMTDMKDAISLLGHTALMIYDDEYIVNQRVGLIRADNEINIDYPFLYLLTNDKHFIANLRGRANSGVQVNLSTQAIKESLFNIPDKETNKEFNDLVKPLFEKRKHNYIAIQSLKKTRDTLLPKLMSGKIRVNEIKH